MSSKVKLLVPLCSLPAVATDKQTNKQKQKIKFYTSSSPLQTIPHKLQQVTVVMQQWGVFQDQSW